jgi:membrane protease YdiL (CAAX protease family)
VTEPAPSPEVAPSIPASPVPRVARWRWAIHFVLIGIYPLFGLFVRLLTGRIERGPALSGNVRGLLLVCALELIFFGIFYGAACLISRATREDLFLPWRPGWWVVPLGMGYSLALRFSIVVVAIFVVAVLAATQTVTPEQAQHYFSANRPDVETLVDVSAMRSNPLYYWLTVTVVSFVVAGFREEMWRGGTLAAMRVLWPGLFDSRGGQCLAVALTAIAFGAMHLRMGVLAAVVAGVLGLLLGLIIVLHRSIWPAVIAHGLFDATTLAMLPWVLERAQHLH